MERIGNVTIARATTRALHSPPPGVGEVLRTALPNDFDGIRFEIGRMVEYVQAARKDPLVIDTARMAGAHFAKFVEEMSAREGSPIDVHNNKTLLLEGIDIWCRHHFFYCNDPANVEVMQTPRRMIKTTTIARDVMAHVMEPFYRAMEEANPTFDRRTYNPPPIFVGDCEEAVSLELAMCAALDITPIKFAFGGNGGTLHHVWGRVHADGNWYNTDITEPDYKLGEFTRFEAEEELEIPMGEEE